MTRGITCRIRNVTTNSRRKSNSASSRRGRIATALVGLSLSVMALRGELVAVADSARPSATPGDSTAKVPYQADSAGQWKSGEQIYRSICVPCHETGIGPTIVGLSLPPGVVVTMVRHGLNTMPTFRPSEINDHELQVLSEWVQQSKAPVNKSVSTAGAP